MDHVLVADEAVAGVGNQRLATDGLTVQQCHHGRGADFPVLVGHVSGFGHLWRGQDGVAEYMHVSYCE